MHALRNTDLRIAGAKREAPLDKRGGVSLASSVELIRHGVEIGGRGAVADPYHGEDLAVRLEVLPGAGRAPADHEAEAEGAGIPGLVGEGGLLVLRVEGTDGGEGDGVVSEQHGVVVTEQRGGDVADREHGDADHGARFDADVGLHIGRMVGNESKGNGGEGAKQWSRGKMEVLCFSSVWLKPRSSWSGTGKVSSVWVQPCWKECVLFRGEDFPAPIMPG